LSYTFIFHKQFYFVVYGLKIIGHGNPDNNSESSCMSTFQETTEEAKSLSELHCFFTIFWIQCHRSLIPLLCLCT